ncbi:LOW QUALITY PROTEIN: polycystic kidney disease protein 1-like 2 [Nematostella vectensis]|uniref:LOW QUALITY PROTEIN: polycystic kidney disease protein 1-like 2 n=1 Tax=Nematostella vectensis TaxID=45351 RepID=UPI0020777CF1|nr:LOW QUALITY PROTEIN: polycystic kidney disease protein 1-like 2 [Nematostella vectensis]
MRNNYSFFLLLIVFCKEADVCAALNHRKGDVRLVGGLNQYEGRVEIYYNNEWGTICDHDWNIAEAMVVCRQLGFVTALYNPHNAAFGQGIGTIWLDSVTCNGSEDSLLSCSGIGTFGRTSCTHARDASVVCQQPTVPAKITHLGCYADTAQRALRYMLATFEIPSDSMVEDCAQKVAAAGYRYFGFQYNSQCFSDEEGGSRYFKYGKAYGCSQNGTGGKWAQNIYKLNTMYVNLTVDITAKRYDISMLSHVSDNYRELRAKMRETLDPVLTLLDGTWIVRHMRLWPGTGVLMEISILNIAGNDTLKLFKERMLLALAEKELNHNATHIGAYGASCMPPYIRVHISKNSSAPTLFMCSEHRYLLSTTLFSCGDVKYDWSFWTLNKTEVTGPRNTITTTKHALIKAASLKAGDYFVRLSASVDYVQGMVSYSYGFVRVTAAKPRVKFLRNESSFFLWADDPWIRINVSLVTPNTCPPDQAYVNITSQYTVYWFCWRYPESMRFYKEGDLDTIPVVDQIPRPEKDNGGCFGRGPGRMNVTKDWYLLDPSRIVPRGESIYIGARVVMGNVIVDYSYDTYQIDEPLGKSNISISTPEAKLSATSTMTLPLSSTTLLSSPLSSSSLLITSLLSSLSSLSQSPSLLAPLLSSASTSTLPSLPIKTITTFTRSADTSLNVTLLTPTSAFAISTTVTRNANSRCSVPTARISSLGRSLLNPLTVPRSKSHTIKGEVDLNCDSINGTRFLWTVRAVNISGDITSDEQIVGVNSAQWTISKHSLAYGMYIVQFTVHTSGERDYTAIDYGILNIVQSPLVAVVLGGDFVVRGRDQMINLDASNSYDPDVGRELYDEMSFTWLCRVQGELWPQSDLTSLPYVTQASASGAGCFGTGIGRLRGLPNNPRRLVIEKGLLQENRNYEFVIVVRKGNRESLGQQVVSIILGDPLVTYLRCKFNCGGKVNPSSKLSLDVLCDGGICTADTSYSWSLSVQSGTDSTGQLTFQPITDSLEQLTSTALTAPSIVINPFSLTGGVTYRSEVIVTSPGRAASSNQYLFTTNQPPSGGSCHISPTIGLAMITSFNMSCTGWQDNETPLEYQFRYRKSDGTYALIYYGDKMETSAVLPAGREENDFNFDIEATVSDSMGAANQTTLRVQVTPQQLSPNNNILTTTLERLTVGRHSSLGTLLQSGEIGGATQLANAVLSTLDDLDNSTQNHTVSKESKITIKEEIFLGLANVKVDSIKIITQTSAVFATGTNNKDDLSHTSQEITLKTFDSYAEVLEKKSKDDDQDPHEMEKAAKNLLHGTGNILAAASDEAKVYGTEASKTTDKTKQESKERALQADNLIARLSRSVLGRKEAGESPTVFKSLKMTVMLSRDLPDRIGGQVFDEGGCMIALPANPFSQNSARLQTVDTQLRVIQFNPYTWGEMAALITSKVTSLSFQESSGKAISVENLKDPIRMIIPLSLPYTMPPPIRSFVKPSSPQRRKIYVQVAGSSYKLTVQITSGHVSLFVDRSRDVSKSKNLHKAVIPDDNRCKGMSGCDPYSVVIPGSVLAQKGYYYYILMHHAEEGEQPESSCVRRDCGSHGRQKRSCVDIKDPPTTPPPQNITIVPKFDAKTDVNVSLSGSMASCLYWSMEKQEWRSEGCQAGNESTPQGIACVCNHLTSFGGDFLVPPNPIDFDVVILAFSDLAESRNYSVIATVGTVLMVYLFVVVLARRADRKDRKKTGPKISLNQRGSDHASYEVTIATDIWINSGTTADVALIVCGENATSDVIVIRHADFPNRILFARGNNDQFIIHVPTPLGKLLRVKIWHDNEGNSPAWLLRSVTVHATNSEDRWVFPCNRWLAVDKDDGMLDCTLTPHYGLSALKTSFAEKSANDFADDHLWVSVVARSPCNFFSRVQRATCCLSLFTSAMIANAMFYNIGGKSEKVFRLGPMEFGLRQIVIGVQSGLIVAPINLLIVQLFKIGSKLQESYQEKYPIPGNSSKDFSFDYKPLKKKAERPTVALYAVVTFIGYFLAFAVVITSGAFTIFYSMQWGTEISNQWLSSMLVSFVQDLFILQPIKIVVIAVLVTLIFRKATRNKAGPVIETARVERNRNYEINGNDVMCGSLTETEKEEARQRRVTEKSATKKIKQMIVYVVFMVLMSVVCYGNRADHGFYMTQALQQSFLNFDKISKKTDLITWLNGSLLAGLYPAPWYNGLSESNTAYIGDKCSILLGLSRLKQSRVQTGYCTIPKEVRLRFSTCYASYSHSREDTTLANFPGWKPFTPSPLTSLNTTSDNITTALTPDNCPKPWKYHEASSLATLPYWGQKAVYGGGGFVANLGYSESVARRVINDLARDGWFDRRTRAVLAIFSVFNANTDYVSFVNFLAEALTTGTIRPSHRITTIPLYPTSLLYLVFQLLFLLYVMGYLVLICVEVYRKKLSYFKDIWNWLEMLIILFSVATTAVQFVKGIYLTDIVTKIRSNPYGDFSFDYIVMGTELEESLMACLVFFSSLKLMKLVLLHVRVVVISSTMRVSFIRLLPFSFIFIVILLAYAQLGILVFGTMETSYATVYNALVTELMLFIGGDTRINELREVNRVMAPFYVISFMVFMGFILMNVFVAILNEAQFQQKTSLDELSNDVKVIDLINDKIRTVLRLPPKQTRKAETFVTKMQANRSNRQIRDNRDDNVAKVDMGLGATVQYKSLPCKDSDNSRQGQEEDSPLGKQLEDADTSLRVRVQSDSREGLNDDSTMRRKLARATARMIKRQELYKHMNIIHDKLRRAQVLLDLVSLDETSVYMKFTEMLLKVESVRGLSESSPTVEFPDLVERRTSTLTLSDMWLGASLHNENEIKSVFPRPKPVIGNANKQFRPVVIGTQSAVQLSHLAKGSDRFTQQITTSSSKVGTPVPRGINFSLPKKTYSWSPKKK